MKLGQCSHMMTALGVESVTPVSQADWRPGLTFGGHNDIAIGRQAPGNPDLRGKISQDV